MIFSQALLSALALTSAASALPLRRDELANLGSGELIKLLARDEGNAVLLKQRSAAELSQALGEIQAMSARASAPEDADFKGLNGILDVVQCLLSAEGGHFSEQCATLQLDLSDDSGVVERVQNKLASILADLSEALSTATATSTAMTSTAATNTAATATATSPY